MSEFISQLSQLNIFIWGLFFLSVIVNIVLAYRHFFCGQKLKNDQEEINKLEHSAKQLKEIIDRVPVSVVVINKDGQSIMTNSLFRKLVPWFDENNGLNLLKSKRIKEAGLTSKFEDVLKTGIIYNQKGVLVKSPEPYFSMYYDFEIYPLKDEDGKIVGAISIGQETTSLMKAQNSLAEINEKLNQEVRKRTEEFYQINNQLVEKNDFYEKVFNFLADKIKFALKEIDKSQNMQMSGKERERHHEFHRIFKDFILLNQIEKNQLEMDFKRVKIFEFIEQMFADSKYENIVEIENYANQAETVLDSTNIRHIIMSVYRQFAKILSNVKIVIEKKGGQLIIKMDVNFDKLDLQGSPHTNFFWDIQLFLYKEILNLHKGVLQEEVSSKKIRFTFKLLLAENF